MFIQPVTIIKNIHDSNGVLVFLKISLVQVGCGGMDLLSYDMEKTDGLTVEL